MIDELVRDAETQIASGNHELAFTLLRAAIAQQPNSIPAYLALGELLFKNKNYVAAAGCYYKVLGDLPELASARIHLAFALFNAGDAVNAMKQLRLSKASALHTPLDHANLAALYLDFGKFREALHHADIALTANSHDAELHCRRGTALLGLGRYSEGWKEYEWRRGVPVALLQAGHWSGGGETVEAVYGIPSDAPRWSGRPVGHLVVHHEHGFGDTLQWCRYLPRARSRCERLTVVVPRSMVGLLQDSFSDIAVTDQLPDDFDAYVWLDSLPYHCEDSSRIIGPYLKASKCDQWQSRLKAYQRRRIGVVWSGRAGLHTDQWRSMPFEQLEPILNLDADFFSLQKENYQPHPNLVDLGSEFTDWRDTAGAIAAMDLVISVDTSTAHLGGALGGPVWLLNRHNSCWRWGSKGAGSVWYRSMRIFRQSEIGDWSTVVAAMTAALRKRH